MWTVFVLLLLFVVGVYAGKDYYSILGVSRDANDKQLKKAYHKMSKKYHPDRSDDPDAQDRFMEAANAYEILSDPDKRAIYDRYGEEGLSSNGGGGNPHGSAGQFDPMEMFSQFFGGGGGGGFQFTTGGFGNQQATPQRQPTDFYKGDPNVLKLTGVNFNSLLNSDHDIAIVEFCASTETRCKDMARVWTKLASSVSSFMKVGSVDVDYDSSLATQFKVTKYPTILMFNYKRFTTPIIYKGKYSAKMLYNFILENIPALVESVSAKNWNAYLSSYRSFPKVVLFSSKSTPSPLFRVLAKDFDPGVKFVHVHAITPNQDIVKEFDVQQLPTVVFIDPSGTPTVYSEATVDYSKLRGFVARQVHSIPRKQDTQTVTLFSSDDVLAKSGLNAIFFVPEATLKPDVWIEEIMAPFLTDSIRFLFARCHEKPIWVEKCNIDPKYPTLVLYKSRSKRFASTSVSSLLDEDYTVVFKDFIERALEGSVKYEKLP